MRSKKLLELIAKLELECKRNIGHKQNYIDIADADGSDVAGPSLDEICQVFDEIQNIV